MGQERSMKQTPTDVRGMMHVSQVPNTTYKERVDENLKTFGQRRVDESNVMHRTSTYQRAPLNEEERSFGGVHQTQTQMEYKSSRVEKPQKTVTNTQYTTYQTQPQVTREVTYQTQP